jgi:protein-tyrosine phosphatase
LAANGVDALVSLLESSEERELGLEREAASCSASGLAFVRLPIPDLGAPARFADFGEVLKDLVGQLRSGRRIAVHCRQSVGRSGLLGVSIAIASGIDLQSAVTMVSEARGVRVPETPVQFEWLRQHQDQLFELAGQR